VKLDLAKTIGYHAIPIKFTNICKKFCAYQRLNDMYLLVLALLHAIIENEADARILSLAAEAQEPHVPQNITAVQYFVEKRRPACHQSPLLVA
jgi:hypothetical protein